MDRVVWTVVAAAVLWAAGCGNRSTNPIGGDLIARDPGQVVMLPALGLSAGAQKFGGVTPVVAGGFEEMS